MSESPPIRRLSTTSSSPGNLKREENLINAYEAEEERIINVLSRKLEQLREDKIHLENVLEAENESHVNRLTRELSALRIAQQQQQQQAQQSQQSQAQTNGTGASSSSNGIGSGYNSGGSNLNGYGAASPDARVGMQMFMSGQSPLSPSAEVMLDAMRRENEHLRGRLVETERDYVRILRLNEIYREELIDHRRRLGLSVDNLIGLSSSLDPFSQPTHRRSFSSNVSSPSASASYSNLTSQLHSHPSQIPGARPPSYAPAPTHGVPIPRPPSQIHRPGADQPYLSPEASTPLSHSPSSSSVESPFPFSPVTTTHPTSFVSNGTHLTTPPSSVSLNSNAPIVGPYPGMSMAAPAQGLSYPSVPPPSLSSSFGSPVISYVPHREASHSPVEPLSRRNSNAQQQQQMGRRRSVDRGGRIAETGMLVPRSRAGSHSLAATAEDAGENRNGRL